MHQRVEPGRTAVLRRALAFPAADGGAAASALTENERRGGFARRYLTLFAGEVFSKACVFAAFAYLARVLGPSGFGLIELALSITLFFVMLVDGGLGTFGARVVNAAPDEAPRLLARITAVRALVAAGAYVPLLVISLLTGLPGAGILAVYGLAVFFVPLFNHWLFQGLRSMHLVAAGTALRNAVFALVVFAFVRDPGDLSRVALAEVSGVAALAVFTTLVLAAVLRVRPDTSDLVRGAAQIVRQAWPLGASEVTWAALWYSPGVVLGALSTTEEVAWLAGPLRIVLALHTFVWLYFFNLLPGLSRALATDDAEWRSLAARSMRTSMWPACIVALTGTLMAPAIVRMVYGAGFEAAALPLQIVVWMIPLCWFSGHFRYSLIAAGQQRSEFHALAATVAATLGVACVLSPQFGAPGAAAALVTGGAVNALLAWIATRQRVGSFGASHALGGPAVSCVLCLALGLAVRPLWGSMTATALALACYAILALRRESELTRLARVWLQPSQPSH